MNRQICERCEERPAVGLCHGCCGVFCAYCALIHKHRGELDLPDRTLTLIGDGWQLGATFERDSAAGKVSGGVEIRATW